MATAGRRPSPAATTPLPATRGASRCTPGVADMKLPFTLPSFAPSLSFESLVDYVMTRSERERRMLALGAVALVLILVFVIIVPLDRSVAHAKTRLTQKRADLAWMQGVSAEIMNSNAPSSARESLILIIDRSAREAGLEKARSEEHTSELQS